MLSRKPLPFPLAGPAHRLTEVDRAVSDIRRGGVVLLRAGAELAFCLAAEGATAETMARLAAFGSRPVELAITRRRAAALGLVPTPTEPAGAVLVDLPAGIGAVDVRALADPGMQLGADRPAPIGPASIRPAEPRGVADAAVELAKLARLLPAMLIVPVGEAQGAAALREDGLLTVEADQIFGYHAAAARSLKRVAAARVPLADAEDAQIVAFRPADGGLEHLAIVIGSPDGSAPVLARLHSECFTGDLLGSLRCDCGDQLRGAIAAIAASGGGVLLYLAQEGRGIGLVNKLRAYELQDDGFDTVDANEQLGFDADERVYLPAAEMLRLLGLTRIRLLTNNPEKVASLSRCGIAVVERVPHVIPANGHNERYLRTKATRSGHLL